MERRGSGVEIEDGATDDTSQVWGTYIHGIFDNDLFRLALLNHVRQKIGLPLKNSAVSIDKEAEFDKLADCLRKSLDINKIYRIMGVK